MDADGSGSICFEEICSRLRRLNFSPPVIVTMSDFATITQNGALCGEGGEMAPRDFEVAMRQQLRLYLQVPGRLEGIVRFTPDFTPDLHLVGRRRTCRDRSPSTH
jgi:hypothetical protein